VVPVDENDDSDSSCPNVSKILYLLNNADQAKLVKTLATIGPKRASQIVKYRELHGAFKTVDDLVNVDGLGEKFAVTLVAKNQDL